MMHSHAVTEKGETSVYKCAKQRIVDAVLADMQMNEKRCVHKEIVS